MRLACDLPASSRYLLAQLLYADTMHHSMYCRFCSSTPDAPILKLRLVSASALHIKEVVPSLQHHDGQ